MLSTPQSLQFLTSPSMHDDLVLVSTRLCQSMPLGLCMLVGTSSCQVTMTELKALNPSAATLVVPCRPSQIPDNVKVIAFRSESRHIVTDEDRNELLHFAPLATAFIEFNDAAPPDQLGIMAADYGLLCPKM